MQNDNLKTHESCLFLSFVYLYFYIEQFFGGKLTEGEKKFKINIKHNVYIN